MSKRTRLTPDQRQMQILDAAITIALECGLYNFSVINVARSVPDLTKETVKHYFKNATMLRTAVVIEAIDRGGKDHNRLIAQAITMRDDAVEHLTKEQRRGYLKDV